MAFRPPLPPPSNPHFDKDGKPNVGKAQWLNAVDQMLGSMGIQVADGQLLANISGEQALPAGATLSAVLDHIIGNSRGTILVRGAAGWTALALGTNGQVLESNGTDLVYATLPAGVFSASYTSAQQTITAGGALTLAHGLGVTPSLIQMRIVCKTAELNYSINDEVVINPSIDDFTNSRGISIVPDATNLNVRFGSQGSTFAITDKTSGNSGGITDANWKIVFRAWA